MDWKAFTAAVGVGSIRKVLGRIGLEFVPPGVIGLLSLWAFGDFFKGFVVAILAWAPYLRIVHQENQRQQFSGVLTELSAIKAVLSKLPPSEAATVEAVNNLINNVVRHVQMVAEPTFRFGAGNAEMYRGTPLSLAVAATSGLTEPPPHETGSKSGGQK